jgi:hypothetical protein
LIISRDSTTRSGDRVLRAPAQVIKHSVKGQENVGKAILAKKPARLQLQIIRNK